MADGHEDAIQFAIRGDRVGSVTRWRYHNLAHDQGGDHVVRGECVNDRHADPVRTATKIYAFISGVKPDLVTTDAGDSVHDGAGCDFQDIAATRHQTLSWNENQSSRMAGGRECSGDLHGDGIDLIHFSVWISHSRRDCQVEPSRFPVPDWLLNAARRFRVAVVAVIDNRTDHMRWRRCRDESDKRGRNILIIGDQNEMMRWVIREFIRAMVSARTHGKRRG